MKQIIRTLFCALLGLIIGVMPVVTAGAESAETAGLLTQLYRAGTDLVTSCSNLTLEGTADLSLDGTPFKHAEGLLAQENLTAYRQIELQSPRRDGTIRENGYAVMDRGGYGYSLEYYLGKTVVRPIANAPKEYPLRPTVENRTLLSMGQGIASALDQLWADRITAETNSEGTKISLSVEETDFPILAKAGLNLAWQAAMHHFYELSYEDMNPNGYADPEDYMTIWEGIRYSAREWNPLMLQFEAELDKEGRLISLAGKTRLQLICRSDSLRTMEVSFSLKGRDFGTTVVDGIIPDKYRASEPFGTGVSGDELESYFETLPSKGGSWERLGYLPIPVPESQVQQRDIRTGAEAADYAMEIMGMDFLAVEDEDLNRLERLTWLTSQEDDIWKAVGFFPENMDEPAVSVSFANDGQVLQIRNYQSSLESAEESWDETLDTDEAIRYRTELGLMIWRFAENLNPGSTGMTDAEMKESLAHGIGFTSYDQTLSTGEETFVRFYGNLHQNPQEKVRYVIQTYPVVRLVELDATIDPEAEGGNG